MRGLQTVTEDVFMYCTFTLKLFSSVKVILRGWIAYKMQMVLPFTSACYAFQDTGSSSDVCVNHQWPTNLTHSASGMGEWKGSFKQGDYGRSCE